MEMTGLQIFKFLPAAKKKNTQTAKSVAVQPAWLLR